MKKAEKKRTPLFAHLGDINRPLRVRPVRYLGLEWWEIDAEDTWPGIVMDLRRLGFEAMAMGEGVLVREPDNVYEPLMDNPAAPGGLRPFPSVHPTIQIRKAAPAPSLEDYSELEYLDENEDEDDNGEDNVWEPEDLDDDEQ